jgi:hypothetical protein
MRAWTDRLGAGAAAGALAAGIRWLAHRGAGEVLAAMAVLGLVVLLAVPISPPVLDALVALDLAASALLLATALLAREPLRLAAFPTLILLTTLFRVALNVGSTRLILSRGEAGRVIEAFGRVVRGPSAWPRWRRASPSTPSPASRCPSTPTCAPASSTRPRPGGDGGRWSGRASSTGPWMVRSSS